MKNILYLSFYLLVSACVSSSGLSYSSLAAGDEIPSESGELDHSAWDKLLNQHVNSDGFVDYQAFLENHEGLKSYLAYLGKNSPADDTPINEQFAYYINLYNAATIHIMLENDIPASIKDIGSVVNPVWIQDFIEIGDSNYSLADIEKGVLQEMGDPRIHFAINCASYSCPKLMDTAYTAENVDEMMNQAATKFVNSDKNDLSDPDNPKLSSIFKWYRSDFTDSGMSLIEYVNQYADKKISPDAEVDYLDYDWSINKQ